MPRPFVSDKEKEEEEEEDWQSWERCRTPGRDLECFSKTSLSSISSSSSSDEDEDETPALAPTASARTGTPSNETEAESSDATTVGDGGDFVLEIVIPQEDVGAIINPTEMEPTSATDQFGSPLTEPSESVGTGGVESPAAGIRIQRPSIVLRPSSWNPKRPEDQEFWLPPPPLQYQLMSQEDAQEIRAGLEAGGMLEMPGDDVLVDFWARLVGNVRTQFASTLDENRYRPWAAYIKFIFRRAGSVSTRLVRWVLSMVAKCDPFRNLGSLAPHHLDATEQAELDQARAKDAARYGRYMQNNNPTRVASRQWKPKRTWESPSSSLDSPKCSLLPTPSSSTSSFSASIVTAPLPHRPPPPPPPRSVSFSLPPPVPLLSLPLPTRFRTMSHVRTAGLPRTPRRSALTGEIVNDPWAPNPIAVIQHGIREAAEGVEAAMEWRHNRVVGEITRFNREEARVREERVRATAPPADKAYVDALERRRREKGKCFPTYASDRKSRPRYAEALVSRQDARSGLPPLLPSSSTSRRRFDASTTASSSSSSRQRSPIAGPSRERSPPPPAPAPLSRRRQRERDCSSSSPECVDIRPSAPFQHQRDNKVRKKGPSDK